MEVQHLLIQKSSSLGHLTPLAASRLRGRTSLYVDDVFTFLRPSVGDFMPFVALIEDFGVASGLRINLDKCSAHLIRCEGPVEGMVMHELGCLVIPFPLCYDGSAALPGGQCRRPSAEMACEPA